MSPTQPPSQPTPTTSTETPTTAPGRTRRAARRRPGPFPVTVTRPATINAPALTPAQVQRRRSAASDLAHIAAAAANGYRPSDIATTPMPTVAEAPVLRDILRAAPAIVAGDDPWATRAARNRRGRVIVVLVHGPTWSLLIYPAEPEPLSWVYLDDYGGVGMSCLDPVSDWADMVQTILATVSGRTA